ncbi:Esterase/lipase [Pseudonocardia sp. Ae168_Ps1]|uniref:alpha/beta hydrolase n=1 Tax=unclassified Pseudonocardia TaxID=2619320 RepID=UPI00094B5DB5|nr:MULTISPECIES: alpha/beta hydrolase [unclassified Pseudonocardia]OLL72598.1 Esterase/lipase [Pseudonocardia sp. Ae150A_Ps1]OLL78570.1 Esterase/lipase [Pseudonocardia sp. Ae168_Ps1]OLL87304.1 Esterase/lipase [Pseudonocardia sp. Ae263_Ps1]OLL92666.1 Esterase/lipase [Pseudonocardia sp. Ae356_Ps1]OLM19148.1 Esterase/lipase [Pseudonocardia sp. Ae707_Ps1]
MTSFLRRSALVWAAVLLVVLVGAFRPETPVIGFAGSFVTGQYPLHAAIAAVLGILIGLAARKAGAPVVGWATATVALAVTVGMVTVLAAQGRAAAGEGVRLDWTSALTGIGQPSGNPDRTVEYAPGRSMDLYLPAGPGPHPTMVWTHGGSWTSGDRTDRTAMHRWLADRGWAVAAIDYRFPPPEPIGREQQRDVACAVDRIRSGAEGELDPGRLVLGGQSAGATLALGAASGLLDGTLACSEAPAAFGGTGPADAPPPAPGPPPVGVVAFHPPVDLTLIDPGLQQTLLGGAAADAPGLLRLLSPAEQVRPELPPTLILLGSADHYVFPDRVVAYDAELRAAGVPGRLVTVPYADHVFDRPFGSPGAQLAREAVLRFLTDPG